MIISRTYLAIVWYRPCSISETVQCSPSEWGNSPIVLNLQSKMFCVLWTRVSIEHWRLSPGGGHSIKRKESYASVILRTPLHGFTHILPSLLASPHFLLRAGTFYLPSCILSQDTQAFPSQFCQHQQPGLGLPLSLPAAGLQQAKPKRGGWGKAAANTETPSVGLGFSVFNSP